jgi:hypothetical protein
MFRALVLCVATTLLVQSGQATLTVTAVPDQCAKATAMELWRKSSEEIPRSFDQPYEAGGWSNPLLGRGAVLNVWLIRIEREPVGADCRWAFPDVREGEYVARLVRPDGSGGSQAGTVRAGTSQTIDIPEPTVMLSGLVTLDGLPHGGEIQIRDHPWTRPTVIVTADAAGHYMAMLDRPAMYLITVRAAARGHDARVAELDKGVNQLDLPATTPTSVLTLGSLTVPERALPDGCRLRPYVPDVPSSPPARVGNVSVVSANPESLPGNPWIGFNRGVLINLLGTAPVPDGPPPTVVNCARCRTNHSCTCARAIARSTNRRTAAPWRSAPCVSMTPRTCRPPWPYQANQVEPQVINSRLVRSSSRSSRLAKRNVHTPLMRIFGT